MKHEIDDATYHRDRAASERDRSLAARCPQAVRAHLELSSLHMRRAEALGVTWPKLLLVT